MDGHDMKAQRVLVIALTWCLATTVFAQARDDRWTASDTESLMKKWQIDVWRHGNIELVTKIVGTPYVRHTATGTDEVSAVEYAAIIKKAREVRLRFDVVATIRDAFYTNDKAYIRWHYNAQNPDTKENSGSDAMSIYRIEGGRLVEHWFLQGPRGVVTWPN